MNALNQINIDITNTDNADDSNQTLLILDALDLASVGGGIDIAVA
jgi:hypothetical protein